MEMLWIQLLWGGLTYSLIFYDHTTLELKVKILKYVQVFQLACSQMGVLSDFDNFEFFTSDFDNLVLILLQDRPPVSFEHWKSCVNMKKNSSVVYFYNILFKFQELNEKKVKNEKKTKLWLQQQIRNQFLHILH